MEGKSKLRAFLNKAKKKQTESATTSDVAETSEATQQVAGLVVIPEHSSESPVAVAIDGVQPKVLEQWGVAEDEELVDDVEGAVVKAPAADRDLSDEDDEIDLPSSKVRGNFDWGRKADEGAKTTKVESPPVEDEDEIARKRAEASFGLKLKKRKAKSALTDLGDAQEYPDLMAAAITQAKPVKQTLGDILRDRQAAAEAAKLREEKELIEAANSVLVELVPNWPENWPKTSSDEKSIKARYSCRVLQVPRLVLG